MKQALAVARKELKAYFGSPMAAIFIGAFLLVSLFSFFWVETFFARNIADIRPLFSWMPLLMIFLVAALTMRQWSEEQRVGTLEILLTLPVRIPYLVLGKFLAVLTLVALALALTAGLPLTVSFLGDLDWGTVAGGYLGALLMAGAYIAIGLYISSRTDNQIISLMLSVLLSGLFYLAGSRGVTAFMGNAAGDFFRTLGTGSRFASIERGVIDLRDLFYYLSLTFLFLTLNVVALDRKRWSRGSLRTARYRRSVRITVILVAANLAAANIWLAKMPGLRLDLTENRIYSLSEPSRDLLANLQEPLLLRGYFSDRTHPLLAPLVPRIKDMLREYRETGRGRVTVEFIDPRLDEEAEAEANRQYGIQPVPFQVAGRYESAVVNSYFHVLIKYGDQYVTLGFDDLIEVTGQESGRLEVRLRNLEYDLTRSIKKTVYGFQSLDSVFAGLSEPARLITVVTPDTLPDQLASIPGRIASATEELKKLAGEKLQTMTINPDSPEAPAQGNDRQAMRKRYGLEPMTPYLFSPDTFYLHLLLEMGDRSEVIYLSGEMGEADIRREIEAALKRGAAGFLKTVGLVLPEAGQSPMGGPRSGSGYSLVEEILSENYRIRHVDLSTGRPPGDIDVLLLVAPSDMTDLERFSVDQYLMQGGAVVALAGRYVLDITPYSESLRIKKVEDGIGALLERYGVTVGNELVMDRQNEPFPVPVTRNIGGFQVREIRRLDYPFFVDVRQDGMAENPMLANLPAVTLHWPSPVTGRQSPRQETLLFSSPESWLTDDPDIEPDFQRYPDFGFAAGDAVGRQPLAVTARGPFDSYFNRENDPRPALPDEKPAPETAEGEEEPEVELLRRPLIDKAPGSARLVVVGSSEFVNDAIVSMSRSLGGDRYLNNLEFLQNLIDWSVEDEELLAIRSRGSHARLLAPLTRREQTFWEWFNYGLALAALIAVSLVGVSSLRKEKPIPLPDIHSDGGDET